MFDPAQFAKIARGLCTRVDLDSETRARTMWGRAYYSLFLAVRSKIRDAEGAPAHGRNDKIDHGALRNSLYNSRSPDLAALAKVLEELYEGRRQADYVLDPEAHWANKLKPTKADHMAKKVEAIIRSDLPSIDFAPVKGKV